MSQRPRKRKADGLDTKPPDTSPPAPVKPRAPAPRPGLEGFERWLQKAMAVKLLLVIVVAFLFKVFMPSQVSFTLGLAVGLGVLIAIYIVGFYRSPPHS